MKEKKGKKSLVDIDNFRSTRLKQLTFSQKGLGATSTRISADSILPTFPSSVSITNDSILMCNDIGKYIENKAIFDVYYLEYYTDLTFLEGGWYCAWKDGYKPRDGRYRFNNQSGYLFVHFSTKFKDGICSNCYKYSYLEPGNLCVTVDSHQGKIFAVLISNISQINALNQTGAVDSDGVYLSDTITNVINSNSLLKNVIDDIRSRNNNDSTPIYSRRLSPPMSLLSSTPLNFYGMEDTVVNIKDDFIILRQLFRVFINSKDYKYLPTDYLQKLSFKIQNLSTFDFDDNNKQLPGVAELVNNISIKFKKSGFCTISYIIEPHEDTENIYENPEGPGFYGSKVFSLQIKATIYPK